MHTQVLKRSGTAVEQRRAACILPLLKRPHWLLVTLLLCNTCATEALPMLLSRLLNPTEAVIVSITAVLVFGDMMPHAICSRYAVAAIYKYTPTNPHTFCQYNSV